MVKIAEALGRTTLSVERKIRRLGREKLKPAGFESTTALTPNPVVSGEDHVVKELLNERQNT